VLLGTARAARAAVVVPSPAVHTTLTGPLRTLLAAVADLEVREGTGETSIVLTRCRPAAPGSAVSAVLGFLVAHPAAKVGNAWRDALIAHAGSQGRVMTKNEARALIRDTGVPERPLQLRLGELPLDALSHLMAALPRTVGAVADQ
jgi:hypothetical protein